MPSLVSSWVLTLINMNSGVCKTIKQIGLTKYDWPKIILQVCSIYIVPNTLYLHTVDLTNKSILGMKLHILYYVPYIYIYIYMYVYIYIYIYIYIYMYIVLYTYILHIYVIILYVYNDIYYIYH